MTPHTKIWNVISAALAAALLTLLFGALPAPASARPLQDEQPLPGAKSLVHDFHSAEYTDSRNRRWSVVKVGGITVFGILTDAGNFTRQERARIISERLADLDAMDFGMTRKERYIIRTLNRETTLCINVPRTASDSRSQFLVVTVDVNFARRLGHTRADIAAYWRDLMIFNLKRGGVKGSPLDQQKDWLGRPLDPDATWLNIPDGYAARAK